MGRPTEEPSGVACWKMDIAYSVNGVPIRLTDERWGHIVEEHDDMAGCYEDCLQVIENPDLVFAGTRGSSEQ